MSEATSNVTPQAAQLPLVDLNTHADGTLLRVCAALERLRAIADELEHIAAGIPARTAFGRKMKELAL